MKVNKVFLEGVLSELSSLIEYKNNHLKSQIRCDDLDSPDYHDGETCFQLQLIISEMKGEFYVEKRFNLRKGYMWYVSKKSKYTAGITFYGNFDDKQDAINQAKKLNEQTDSEL